MPIGAIEECSEPDIFWSNALLGEKTMFDEEKRQYFKALLNKRLDQLLRDFNETVNGMTGAEDKFPDPSDRATAESERSFTLRIRDRERKLIVKIKEALERIENGSYGICEDCEEEISEERLEARPVTTLCIECKRKQENMERIKGT